LSKKIKIIVEERIVERHTCFGFNNKKKKETLRQRNAKLRERRAKFKKMQWWEKEKYTESNDRNIKKLKCNNKRKRKEVENEKRNSNKKHGKKKETQT
jgi:hypothetical protein